MTSSGYGRILRGLSLIPKKRLGQHFMVDPGLLRAIARLMIPESGSWVALEIGTGLGNLTRELATRAQRVYSVEFDRSLAPAIQETCGQLPNVSIIWGDALGMDLSGYTLREENSDNSLILCGNLPYYLTSELLYAALVKRPRWDRIAVVVQEEVGERMASPSGTKDFGRLSLWCQYRAHVTIAKRIPRGAFVPPPDVESCLALMDINDSFPLSPEEEAVLNKISRAAFSRRRKTIRNGLLSIIANGEALDEVLTTTGVDGRLRPEDLGIGEFVALAKNLSPLL